MIKPEFKTVAKYYIIILLRKKYTITTRSHNIGTYAIREIVQTTIMRS